MVRQWYWRNREKRLEQLKAWNKAHPETIRKATEKYRSKYPERRAAYVERSKPRKSEYHRKWYAENLETKRAKNRQWSKKNPSRHLALCAKRRAETLQAIPKWANLEAIAAIYAQARLLTKSTGIKHDVDHVIPLRGETVCGLHVENNLQILAARVNRSKGNRYSNA